MNPDLKSGRPQTLLTDLPDDLIDSILMRLPLKQAGRMSILSTRWRYASTRIPQLIFNKQYYRGVKGEYLSWKSIFRSIFQVLMLHQAPLRKFSFQGFEKFRELYEVLEIIFRDGHGICIEDLRLTNRYNIIPRPVLLPLSFFSCLQLKHLHLSDCELRPPTTCQGFHQLISLRLSRVRLVGDSIQSPFSHCPQLERLTLVDCVGLSVDLTSSNLRKMSIQGRYNTVRFKNLPKLVEAYIAIRVDVATYIDDFFSGPQSIENLTMLSFRSLLAAPVISKRSLSSLKALHLMDVDVNSSHDIACALWLIKNSSNLESIRILSSPSSGAVDDKHAVQLVKAQEDRHDVSLNHLHEVRMRRVKGKPAELEFIKFILATSPNLTKYSIAASSDKVKLDMIATIAEFPRSSPKVEIKYQAVPKPR